MVSSLFAQVPAGSYRLRVSSDLPSGGNYLLKYAFLAGSPRPCTAGVLNLGDQLIRVLTEASCRTSLGLSDVYTLTMPVPGTVDLEIDSTSFDTVLAIRDGKDNLIVRDDEVSGLSVARITADLPAGVYTVVGAATSGAGNYQLTARFTAHDTSPFPNRWICSGQSRLGPRVIGVRPAGGLLRPSPRRQMRWYSPS